MDCYVFWLVSPWGYALPDMGKAHDSNIYLARDGSMSKHTFEKPAVQHQNEDEPHLLPGGLTVIPSISEHLHVSSSYVHSVMN